MHAVFLMAATGLFGPTENPFEKAAESALKLVRITRGRALGALVRPGMTRKEANRWLRHHECTVFISSGSPVLCYYYNDNLAVSFEYNSNGEARVVAVRCFGSFADVFR
jgi:hypothetical protein